MFDSHGRFSSKKFAKAFDEMLIRTIFMVQLDDL